MRADIGGMELGRFLCRDEAERRRMLGVARLLYPGTPYLFGLFMLAGVAGVGVYGWLGILPAAVCLVLFAVIWKEDMTRASRPELAWAGLFVACELMLALAEFLGHGPRGFTLAVMAMPVLLVAVVFPRRVVVAATAMAVALTVAILLGSDLAEVRQTPAVALCAVFVIIILAASAVTIRDLDDASRRLAFVDELTGTLNRSALTPKLVEITQQARLTGEPIAVIVADVDCYKEINDVHGHAIGESVLREVARRLGECVGAFEPVYRLGGEEFVMLLPGLRAAAAQDVAQRMWRSVRDRPVGDVAVTMSFGIASSAIEEAFDFDAVFACADAALHAAKRAGRDRVHVAGAADPGYGPERTAQTAAGEGATKSERAGGDSGVDGRANPAPPARGERSEVAARGVASSFAERARVVSADLERDYVIDLNERLATLFRVIAVGVFVVIATQIGEFGWHVLIPPILGAVPYYLLSHNAHRFRRPSVAIAGSWALLQSSIAAGFLLSRGAPLFALPLLVLIVPGRCAVLRTRAAAAGTAYTAVLMIAVAFAMDSSRVLGDPAVVLFGLALLAEAAFAGAVVGGSAVGFRGASTVDSLTGLLNRHALGARLAELDAAAHDRPRSVAIVVGDLDQFRAVNDSVGHAAGDAALRGVAERITASLRTFQRAYRVGGEEFLVLLPDTDVETAGRVAERLRHVVGARPCGGQIVTMSFGVAANAPGTRFDHRDVLARADAALYDAKHLGRDTVVVDRPPERAVTVGAAVAQA